MTRIRNAFATFCDDVRYELYGKHSLIGIYSSDLIVAASAPATLPKLVVAVWAIADIDDPIETLMVEMFAPPNREKIFHFVATRNPQAKLEADLTAGARRILVNQIFPFAPFTLPTDGFIEVDVTMDGETVRAGRVLIRFVPEGQTPEVAA